jgi:cytochrome c biogenesis protein ResB
MNSVSLAPAEAVQPGNHTDLFDDLWRVFASPRLALFLMLGIAAACLVGALELVPVFETFWFRVLLAVLAANIGICTVNRLPGIWQAVFHPAEALFERGQPRDVVLLASHSCDAVRPALRAALTRLHVVQTPEPSGLYLYIDQNRFARFGMTACHCSEKSAACCC